MLSGPPALFAVLISRAHLVDFDALVRENPDLARLVRSPVFSSEEQFHAITAVLERVGIGGLAGNFLKVAARNRRPTRCWRAR